MAKETDENDFEALDRLARGITPEKLRPLSTEQQRRWDTARLMTIPSQLSTGEVARRGQEIYDRRLRPQVEAGHSGRFLVLDIVTGDFEIADDDLTASDRALARNPGAILYGVRIGSPAAYRIGSVSPAGRP